MKKIAIFIFSILLFPFSMRGQAPVFEDAFAAVSHMGLGWNLGNTFDSHAIDESGVTETETMRGQPVTRPELMEMMKKAGFNTIRVPVTWYPHMDVDDNIDPAWMARVKEVVDYVISQGMYCIINVHNDTGKTQAGNNKGWLRASMDNYNANKEHFKNIWRQIAETFRNYGEKLIFEGYNEMLDPIDSWNYPSYNSENHYNADIATSGYNAINSYAADFVTTVRSTGGRNTQRNLIVKTYASAHGGTNNYSSHAVEPLSMLQKPENSEHIIFAVHAYPAIVTSDGVTNMPMDILETRINYIINNLKTHLVSKGAPVIFTEWGTSNVDANPTDYEARKDHMFQFVDLFLQKVKANDMAAFYWMGLSNKEARAYPAFNQDDLAKRMLKAWHGSSYESEVPVMTDYKTVYLAEFLTQYSELQIAYDDTGLENEYKGAELELESAPSTNGGTLSFRAYASSSDEPRQNLANITSATPTLYFSSCSLSIIKRLTVVWRSQGSCTMRIRSVRLIKHDGTKVEVTPTVRNKVTFTTQATPIDGSRDNIVTVGDFTYELNETNGTATVIRCNNSAISGSLTLDNVTYDGKTYTITAVGDGVFGVDGSAGNQFSELTAVNLPNVTTVGNNVFLSGGDGGARFDNLQSISLPNATTAGSHVLCRTGGDDTDLGSLSTVNMPKLATVGDSVFFSTKKAFCPALSTISLPELTTISGKDVFSADSSFLALATLDMPALTTISGKRTFYGEKSFAALQTLNLPALTAVTADSVFSDGGKRNAFMALKTVNLSMACEVSGKRCFNGGGKPIYNIADADVIYNSGTNTFQSRFDRFIVPEGKATLLISKWLRNGSTNHEVYSPVTLSKSGNAYGTLTIPADAAAASFTYEGTAYPNNYNFNHALKKTACLTNPTYNSIYDGSNYEYKWYAATSYSDGMLTITSPSTSSARMGIAPGEGFLISGPAFTGTDDDVIYLPVHTSLAKYTGTNYFRKGTGAAVATTSDGNVNYYFSASMQTFYRCNNTVIPVDKAYLALPASMVADGKQINLVVDDDESATTSIRILNDQSSTPDTQQWYTLDGRLLNNPPTQRGVYIHNGRKEVVR